MRNAFYMIFVALLAAALPACFYSDTDMYLVEPVPGEPPVLTVTTNLDTLVDPVVDDSLEVRYLAEVSNGKFYYLYADLAGSTIYESDSTEGEFWITPYMADSSGIDTLYMEFYFSTNSNSLADQLGYEAQFKTLTFAIDFNLGGGQ